MIKISYADTTYVLNPPNFEGLPAILREKYDRGEYTEIPDLPHPSLPSDWEGLLNRLLSGDLYELFKSITNAAFSNPTVLVARNDIYGAISNPKISDRLGALRAGLDMLENSGFELTEQHKTLWNQAVDELNFPDEVKL
ncbi:hypothetical protein H6F44_11870 [Pseudanabaena sp. FACHB-1277]|uniref:Uncharacterized protein n=1 Tax=Pseudanabaena cinerea FACHB-1277 TaxID=2949581 RepID=A0A926UTG7_9CYAN|nr:hypothetical protein [Pseudanabaena cinerea]MBD2150812.1 hypothetical protein [Pseudanabaena cinerea FACHB-1277]